MPDEQDDLIVPEENDLTTPEGRTRFRDELAATAVKARQKADELLDAGRPRDAQSAVTVSGIALDKLKVMDAGAQHVVTDPVELDRLAMELLTNLLDRAGLRIIPKAEEVGQ